MRDVDRPTIDAVMMETAELWAQRSTCPKKAVGSVLATPQGRVLATGYNGALSGAPHCTEVGCDLNGDGDCVRTIHSEANVIALAARYGVPTQGMHLFVTHLPCYNCMKLLAVAGIQTIVYKHARPKDDTWLRTMEIAQQSRITLIQNSAARNEKV